MNGSRLFLFFSSMDPDDPTAMPVDMSQYIDMDPTALPVDMPEGMEEARAAA